MPDSKILLACAVVFVLILAYFYFKRDTIPKEKAVSRRKRNINDIDSITSQKGARADAAELHEKFHERFIRGMKLEDFQKEYDDKDGIVYLKLKQLYKLGKDSPGVNLMRDITTGDYSKVLEE